MDHNPQIVHNTRDFFDKLIWRHEFHAVFAQQRQAPLPSFLPHRVGHLQVEAHHMRTHVEFAHLVKQRRCLLPMPSLLAR